MRKATLWGGPTRQAWSMWRVHLLVLAVLMLPSAVLGQDRAVPRADYFLSFGLFYEGEFNRALQGFRSAAKSGVRSTEGRWVDSICYHAMIGECLYHMGELGPALDQYTAALKLFLAHRNWMLRVEFPPAITPSSRGPRPAINWGVTSRASRKGHFPQKLLTLQGRFDNAQVLQRGGVVAPLENYPLHVQEIVRCTALAIRRRTEIMGPACPHDPFTGQLVEALARRPAPPNHWSQAWIDVQLGLAYAGAGQTAQAMSELQKSLVAAGQYDHPLTATALLELGKLSLHMEQFNAAANYFLEATFAAAMFEQYEVMSEAFRGGLITHLVSGQKTPYAPLAPAASWARRNSRHLEATLLLAAAENFAAMGITAQAAGLLEQARRTVGRREMGAGRLGARLNYQTALVHYQNGNTAAGNKALAQAMSFQSKASHWLFHISLADRLFTAGAFSDRVADLLYERLLREPSATDWSINPMDTLAVLTTPHTPPMERWFEVALLRKEHEKALQIADRIRRHRFFSTLPMGGRLLALRWVLEAPKNAVSERAQLQRQDLLAKYPAYAQLAERAQALRADLAGLPLVPDDPGQRERQAQWLDELQKVSAAGEIILREVALRREASEFSFPPLADVQSLQQEIPDRQLVLAFFATSRSVYGFVFNRTQYAHWKVETPSKIRSQVASLLRQIGHVEKNFSLGLKELQDDAWKETASQLLQQLSNNTQAEAWDEYDELVIVPDGCLWYLPFEALQVERDGVMQPLISKVRIRYAPTVSLVLPDKRTTRPLARSAIVVGKMSPRDDEEISATALQRLRGVLPGAVGLPAALPAPSSVMVALADRLIVLSDLDEGRARTAYDWSPAYVDRGRPGGQLLDWFSLPWGAPDQVVLPGFHTPAEDSLKHGGTGNEIFLTVCGLMSAGSRTVLLSRWRVGGQSTYDLMREFCQELPHSPATDAWQRSVELSRSRELDPEREPRLKPFASDLMLTADHPFFWAGYLLVDQGTSPKRD